MKKISTFSAIILVSLTLPFGMKAQEVTDAQKAAAEAAKALSEAPVNTPTAPKPSYWTNTLLTNLNFLQNSYNNWAKGGFDNVALNTYIEGNANYKKDNMSWANRAQLDYGFLYSEDKPIFQKNKDGILLESTWGYKATGTLNYASKFTFVSQFSKGYTYGTPSVEDPTKKDWKNARVLKSDIMSPANVTLGLGIDWAPKGNWLTVNFSPITGGFTIVNDESLRKKYGMKLKKGHEESELTYDSKGLLTNGDLYRFARFDFGAQLTADAKMKINDNFSASTHLILFSNYLDNPLNLRVNWNSIVMWKLTKYFSLNVTVKTIYDDTVLITDDDHPDGHKAFQVNEALQFGFSYTFSNKK